MKKQDTWIHKKLRSRRGASITFALLLFLVCVVVGSIVLTAGTAAAGRRAQLEQADRRYYAVTSAAELFRGAITGESIQLERTKVVESEYQYTLIQDEFGNSQRQSSEPVITGGDPVYGVHLVGSDLSFGEDISAGKSDSLLIDVVSALIDMSSPEAAFLSEIKNHRGSDPAEFTLAHNAPAGIPSPEALNVKVTMAVSENGDLVFTFSSTDSENDVYALREIFRLKYDQTEEESSEEGTAQIVQVKEKEYTETIPVKVTNILTSTFSWEYVNLEPLNDPAE